jgi:acetyl esterase/lipase
VVFNPGAFTHTSYALHDAIEAVELPVVEVHISDVESREPWRRISVVRPACLHTVYGRGIDGYRWALRHLHWNAARPADRLPYGAEPDQYLAARIPPSPRGLVVLVHGGFWRHQWTFDTIEGPAVDLAEAGLATVAAEYRRAGRHHPGPAAMVDDVCRAIRAASEAAGVSLDRTVVVGHSAGAQLAAVAASRTGAAGVVSLAGVLDLPAAARLADGAVAAYLSGEAAESVSPASLVPLGVPVTVVDAVDDDEVPAEQAERFAAAATAAGDDVRTLTVPGDHYSFLDPHSPAWQASRHAVLDLLPD